MEILELSPLLASRNVPVALWQMIAITLLYSGFIFSGRFKWGVVLSYFLVTYLILGSDNRMFWVSFLGGEHVGLFSYAVLCLITVSIGVVGLFRENN